MRNRYLLLVLLVITACSALFAQRKIKVAAIGDSVTEGTGLKKEESYPSVLQDLLGDRYEVGNFGHSGATLLRKGHNPYSETRKFSEALAFKGDIAVIHLGLNDTDPRNFPHYSDHFVQDYLWLIDTLKAGNPEMQIFICEMSPVFTGHPRFMSGTFRWYHLIRELISRVAEVRQLPVIDLFEEFHSRPDLFTDAPTLHPNARGAGKIAEVIRQHITGDFGGLQLPPVFTENMVIQRNKPFRIWGKANAGTRVTVAWNQAVKSAESGSDGRWEIVFPPAEADLRPKALSIENEGRKVIFRNVLVGDVWLAAGQSNMEFPLRRAFRGDSLVSLAAGFPGIRLLQLDAYVKTDNVVWDSLALKKANELDFFSGQWLENNAAAASGFSAVAYSFAHELVKDQGVPVGIIHLSVGGSPQLAWLPRLSLESNPAFVGALHPWRKSDYLMAWCRERVEKNLGLTGSPFQQHPYAPSYIFEAGIRPLIPFALSGIIWYQGESDAENAEQYELLFPYFVQEWRTQWKQDFPLFYVQLSSIERPSWPHFRNLQRRLLDTVGNAGMVVTSDIGDANDVHPKEKIVVGERLARWALNRVYGRDMLPSGPLFSGYSRNKSVIELTFMYSEGLTTSDRQALRGFGFQTQEGQLVPGKARIEQGKVLVEAIPGAVSLVYGWEPVSRGNLVNAARLPASTFHILLK